LAKRAATFSDDKLRPFLQESMRLSR
jgi:hypothetical protein